MSSSPAEVKEKRRIPAVWLIPLAAVFLGLWMIYHHISSEGPRIDIRFSTAEGIEAGKTPIKSRNVKLGFVEKVALNEDRESVTVTALLNPDVEHLLQEDTLFWVVRPRVGVGGVSGLDTLLSGGYIELAPGSGEPGRRTYVGLEAPPVTAAGTPGVRLTLVDERAGSLIPGDPVLHRGFTVGRIETASFDVENARMVYEAFVRDPFDQLINTNTRFWNASGIDFTADANGIRVRTGTFHSLISGGIEFDSTSANANTVPIEEGAEFVLYGSYSEAQENPHQAYLEYVIMTEQSLRGLLPGAPVEFRGIQIGRVERVLLDEYALQPGPVNEGNDESIPVLIRVEPGRLRLPDDESGVKRLRDGVVEAVHNRMYATLQTGNLLTGSLIVVFDFYPNEEAGELGEFSGYTTLPTLSTGFQQIQRQVVEVLQAIQDMRLAEIGASTNQALEGFSQTMVTMESTLARVEELLSKDSVSEIPEEFTATLTQLQKSLDSYSKDSPIYERLNGTLQEISRTLRSLDGLARSVEDQPNSLLFRLEREPDPEPGVYP